MADIFISYSREDIDKARALAKELAARGWSVFWDRHIPHGQAFYDVLRKEIDSAKCIICLWSNTWVASHFVRDEAAEGLDGRLLPVLLEAVKPPLGFRQIQAADLSDWNGSEAHQGFRELMTALRSMVPLQDNTPPQPRQPSRSFTPIPPRPHVPRELPDTHATPFECA